MMPDNISTKKLDELARFIGRSTTRKDVRGNRPRKSPEELVEEFCENYTRPEKVFGAPLGEMPPASRTTNVNNEVRSVITCFAL